MTIEVQDGQGGKAWLVQQLEDAKEELGHVTDKLRSVKALVKKASGPPARSRNARTAKPTQAPMKIPAILHDLLILGPSPIARG